MSFPEYRKVIPIKEVENEDNDQGNRASDIIIEEDRRYYYYIIILLLFPFHYYSSVGERQSLISGRYKSAMFGSYEYFLELFEYDNLKSNTRWFLETASVTISINVRILQHYFI